MNLSQCEIGEIHRIVEIRLYDEVKRRFQMLGMTDGVDIEILNKKKNGAVIIKVRGTRFAIGKKFADGVVVGGVE